METVEETAFEDGTFKKDIYEQDKGKILAYYKENGFLDAQILEDRVEYEWEDPTLQEKRAIFIVVKVTEGEKYYFDGYTVDIKSTGEKPVVDPDLLMKSFQLNEKGELFNNTKFLMDKQNISFQYASKGYIFARVIPNRTVTEREVVIDNVKVKRKFVKIDFVIHEGGKAFVEGIIIKGNKKTKDKVIRREILIKEGELFDSRKIQISREKVFNLGFFKQVNFDMRQGSTQDRMNIIVDVEEQPSGTISLGGGYGTTSGFSIFADLAENNLMGNGQRVGIKFEYGFGNTVT
jgi:outer membrane protein insertion porin family